MPLRVSRGGWAGARGSEWWRAREERSASDRTFGTWVPCAVGGLADGSARVQTVRTEAYGSVLTSTRSALAMLCWGARKCDFLNFRKVLEEVIPDACADKLSKRQRVWCVEVLPRVLGPLIEHITNE